MEGGEHMVLITEEIAKTRAFQDLIEFKEDELEKLEDQYEIQVVKEQAKKILDEINKNKDFNISEDLPGSKDNVETIIEKIEMTKKEIIEIKKFFGKYLDDKKDK